MVAVILTTRRLLTPIFKREDKLVDETRPCHLLQSNGNLYRAHRKKTDLPDHKKVDSIRFWINGSQNKKYIDLLRFYNRTLAVTSRKDG